MQEHSASDEAPAEAEQVLLNVIPTQTTAAPDLGAPSSPADESQPYAMTISRLTVDKLGIKMYDRVSAVLVLQP